MSNNKDEKNSDSELFRQAMRDVNPINIKQRDDYRAKIKFKQKIKKEYIPAHWLESTEIDSELTQNQTIFYTKPGLQHKIIRKLKRGDYNSDAWLDLHGLTISQAGQLVQEFLEHCQQHDYKCVGIVHGKGYGSKNNYPVLKNAVVAWLQKAPQVLAFCSCKPAHGGTGALYVLLQRERETL